MEPDLSHERVRLLFDQVLDLPREQRGAHLADACAGDALLYAAVERLLKARDASADVFKTEARPTARVGRYLIRAEIGRGAMGVVYEALDPAIDRSVALKVIRFPANDGPQGGVRKDNLFREARSAGRLLHPGIVVIFDVGQDGDSAYVAMERVDGVSLQQLLTSRGRLSCPEVLKILTKTAAALDYAHSHGVVHRDVKPANIMLQNDGAVKVVDFGVAKMLTSQQSTLDGFVMGTPIYMSPEQIEAKPVSGRADQFSLGVMAYELLSGSRPFEGDSIATLAHRIVYGERPSIHAATPALPAKLDAILRRALNRWPEERFISCTDFVKAIGEALEGQTFTPDATQPARRSAYQGPKLFALLGALILLLVLIGAIVFFRAPLQSYVGQREELHTDSKINEVRTMPIEIHAAPLPPRVLNIPGPDAAVTLQPESDAARAHQLYQTALAKRRGGHPEQALALLEKAATLGDTDSMEELGESYRSGEGAPRNTAQAVRWFRRAAAAGRTSAMLAMGGMELLGEDGEVNEEEAARWFEKAVDRRNAAAMFNLAALYENGRGVPQDTEKAIELYKRSAALGDAEARNRLTELNRAK